MANTVDQPNIAHTKWGIPDLFYNRVNLASIIHSVHLSSSYLSVYLTNILTFLFVLKRVSLYQHTIQKKESERNCRFFQVRLTFNVPLGKFR
ncbi:MAG TPA: hypothetical protein VMV77_01880, partial [Bacteroidales bacterium]|nr:hypothetical protein [Bacteroidales bacterium]